LSSIQMRGAELINLLNPIWDNEQILTPVYHPLLDEHETPEQIAEGFIYTITLQSDTKPHKQHHVPAVLCIGAAIRLLSFHHLRF
jgi:hypothetical protein